MTELRPQKKRLVPASEYIVRKAQRIAWYATGKGLIRSAIIGMIASVWALLYVLWAAYPYSDYEYGFYYLMVFATLFLSVGSIGKGVLDKAERIEDVDLLTPDKATELPDEETLVRSS